MPKFPENTRGKIPLLAMAYAVALTSACSSATELTRETLIEPILIDSVEPIIMESFPAQVAVRVRGVVGDGCSTALPPKVTRSGNRIEILIERSRPRDAICIQIAKLYDETIALPGVYPPGSYVVRVNDIEVSFEVD